VVVEPAQELMVLLVLLIQEVAAVLDQHQALLDILVEQVVQAL
jgi:hypothetical protein